MIVSDVNYDDLLIGDKDAILVAARILGYGKDYEFNYMGESYIVDLTTLEPKQFDEKTIKRGVNSFDYVVPATETKITYKILTHGDEKLIEKELEGLKKINKDSSSEVSTRLKYMITAVEGDSNPKTIRDFVDNYFLARDARAFRKHVNSIQPGVNTIFTSNRGEEVALPVDLSFFWPDL